MSTPVTLPAQSTPAQPVDGAAPVQAAQAASAVGRQAGAAQPFAQLLVQQSDGLQQSSGLQQLSGLQQIGSLPQFDPALAAQAAAPATPSAMPTGGAAQPAAGDADQDAASASQDGALLAAMAMPLMPLTPMQIAQAVQAAQGGTARGADPASAAVNASGAAAPAPAVGAAQDGARRADTATLQSAQSAQSAQAAVQLAAQAGAQAAPAPVRAAAQADQAPQGAQAGRQDGATIRMALQDGAQGAGNGATDGGGAQDGNGERGNAQSTAALAASATGTAVTAAPAASQPGANTVKLAGPPTAWRQSLQEALGERLNVQVGKNVEQAVIRLEPPQLGRIDIAIRHSAGTLEVNISATNGEVLRQLQTVSDNLRSDLSQRQFGEVAVTVTPAARGTSAAPFGDPQQGGRGRQPGRDQDDQEPGRALAEANHATSVFSIAGRE